MVGYFLNIFQSKKIKDTPHVSCITNLIEEHKVHIPSLDRSPDMNELEIALKKNRKGVSFDGLSPDILHIIPKSLKEVILVLIQKVFFNKYPDEWKKQILNTITKPGHTYDYPQLQGIAIASLLSRVYNTIIDNRIRHWFTPNTKQGCLLPLFSLVIMINFCEENKRDFFLAS